MPDGTAVANLAVATSESYKDRDGSRQERTEWHRVALWGRTAEIAGEYLHKGSQAYIEGRLRTRKWTDKDGQDRCTTEIIGDRMQMVAVVADAMARPTATLEETLGISDRLDRHRNTRSRISTATTSRLRWREGKGCSSTSGSGRSGWGFLSGSARISVLFLRAPRWIPRYGCAFKGHVNSKLLPNSFAAADLREIGG